ncbi:hypothetical protein G5C51_40990, partial [Streptomyces sp. A7024]
MVTVWSCVGTLRARREAGAGWLLGVAVLLLAVFFSHGMGSEGGEGHHLPVVTQPAATVTQPATVTDHGTHVVEAPPAHDHAPHDHEVCLARAPQETASSAFSCPLLPDAMRGAVVAAPRT